MGGRKRRDSASTVTRKISQRLDEYLRRYFQGNKTHFAKRLGVPRATLAGWFSAARTSSPGIEQLIALGKRGNINLNWLLLGTPPELRGAPVHGEHVPTLLRAAILAELAAEFAGSEVGTE